MVFLGEISDMRKINPHKAPNIFNKRDPRFEIIIAGIKGKKTNHSLRATGATEQLVFLRE